MVTEYDAKPREIRNFVLVQLGLTVLFLLLLVWMFNGVDADRPAVWVWVLLLAAVALATFFAERVWLGTPALNPGSADATRTGLGIYAGQTVRRLAICEAPILLGVAVAFVTDNAAWPILIAGVPGLLVLTFEIWPSARNLSLTETMLDSKGAESGLIESFLR